MTNKDIRNNAKMRLTLPECEPRKIAFFTWAPYFAVYLLLELVLILLSNTQAHSITDTLKAGSRTSFVQACMYGLSVFQIVWSGCFIGYAKNLYRKKDPNFKTLASYLGRWWTVLSSKILTGLYRALWTALFCLPAFYVFCFSMTPFISEELMELYMSNAVAEEAFNAEMQNAAAAYIQARAYILPLLLFLAGLIAGYAFSYRYRLTVYFALEPGWRSSTSIRASKFLMRKQKLNLFKLDLSLLWYHAVITLPSILLTSVSLFIYPDISDAQYYLCEILGNLWILVFMIFFGSYIETVYAGFAEELMYPPRVEEQPTLLIEHT